MHDLHRLRAWRAAAPSRALVLHGQDGRAGATLIEFRGGSRFEAQYESVPSAAVALAAGQVGWRLVAEPQSQWDLRFAERRRRARARR